MERLPTPAEVLAAVSEAARQIEDETGAFIPTVALRERVCTILYHEPKEQRDAA